MGNTGSSLLTGSGTGMHELAYSAVSEPDIELTERHSPTEERPKSPGSPGSPETPGSPRSQDLPESPERRFLRALLSEGQEEALMASSDINVQSIFVSFLTKLCWDKAKVEGLDNYSYHRVHEGFRWFKSLFVPQSWIYMDDIMAIALECDRDTNVYNLVGVPQNPGPYIQGYRGDLTAFLRKYCNTGWTEPLVVAELLCANKLHNTYFALFPQCFECHASIILVYVLETCRVDRLEKALYGYFNRIKDIPDVQGHFLHDLEAYMEETDGEAERLDVIRSVRDRVASLPVYNKTYR